MYFYFNSMDPLTTLSQLECQCPQNQDHLLEQPLQPLWQFHQMPYAPLHFHWHGTALKYASGVQGLTTGRLTKSFFELFIGWKIIHVLKVPINRRYTKFYGTNGDAAARIAHDAILGNVHSVLFMLNSSLPLSPPFWKSIIEWNSE